jgi:hypothetical protein
MTLQDYKKKIKELVEKGEKQEILKIIEEFYNFRKELILKYFNDYIQTIDKDEFFVNLIFQSSEYKLIIDELNRRYDNSKNKFKEIVSSGGISQLKEILNPLIFTDKRRYRLFHYENLFKRYYLRKITTRYKLEKNQEKQVFRVSIHNTNCPICSKYEGKFLVKFNPTGINELPLNSDNLPPYHPHCRHTISPVPYDIYFSNKKQSS